MLALASFTPVAASARFAMGVGARPAAAVLGPVVSRPQPVCAVGLCARRLSTTIAAPQPKSMFSAEPIRSEAADGAGRVSLRASILNPRALMVQELSGECYTFHSLWLRHNCPNCTTGCLHATTLERLVDPADITPIQSMIESVTEEPLTDSIVIEWGDGHRSKYSSTFLRTHRYDQRPSDAILYAANQGSTRTLGSRKLQRIGDEETPVPRYVLPSNLRNITLRWQDRSPRKMAAVLREFGVIRLEGCPYSEDGEHTLKFISDYFGASVIPTHFGLMEDLRTDNKTNKNTDQLGYTNAAVLPHTDQPFIQSPPSMQMLLCINAADEGGASAVVDAFAAARYLRAQDPWAFVLLSSLPIHFHRKQKQFSSLKVAPLLSCDEFGELVRVRYSYFTMDPWRFSFELMEPYYEAFARFTKLVRESTNQYQALLKPGDLIVYDNARMLHARTAFSGPRWMRGIYIDRDSVLAHWDQNGDAFDCDSTKN